MKLMVIDGNSIVNRAYYGIRPLSTRDGLYTHAIYGFLTTLQRLLDEEQPEALCVTFDRREPTFRHQADERYKAQRKGMPEELAMEIELLDYAMNQTDDVVSVARLDESILQSLASLRFASASGSYRQLDDDVMELKSQVLKRSYTYGEGLDSSQLSALRQSLIEEYRALRTQSSSVTSRITAPVAGVFSSLADGYESLLTPQSILTMTPADLDALMALSYGNGRTVQEEQQEMVLVIGENIKVRRFARYDTGLSVPYVHMGGRIAVLVNLETESTDAAVIELGKDIAMQIAALNPTYMDKSDVSEEFIAKEKEIRLAQAKEDPKNAKKPDAIIEKIVMGGIAKYFKEICLLQQPFVKDDKVSVEDHIAAVAKQIGASIKLVGYTRFEKGEGIEKRQDDLAEEVAKLVK